LADNKKECHTEPVEVRHAVHQIVLSFDRLRMTNDCKTA